MPSHDPTVSQSCNKAFKRPQDLKKHEKIHNEDHINSLRGCTRPSGTMTPPRQEFSMSPYGNPPQVPISPPQSTYSEELSPDNRIFSSRSPSTDMSDHFVEPTPIAPSQQPQPFLAPDYSSPNDILNMIFPMDLGAKPEYNSDVAQRLNYVQSLMDTGALTPTDMDFDVNDQQLADMNVWLSQLSDSISKGDQPMMVDSYLSPEQPYLPNMQYDYVTPVPTTDFHDMYPQSTEQSMYVRSYPTAPNTNDYGYYAAQGLGDVYAPYVSIVGQRQHYTPVPDMAASQYFMPDLHTSLNFTSAKDDAKPKPAVANPTGSQVDKHESESYKPVKAVTLHEDKKNISTLSNVFASVNELRTNEPKTPEEPVENKVEPAKTAVNKDVMDLLVSDLSDLNIDKGKVKTVETPEKKAKKPSAALYPSSGSAPAAIEQHRRLLQQIGNWINQSHAKRGNSATRIGSVGTIQVN
ncbi:hypothetical protein DFQ29_008609 [Apophysomyces sp. BC1021]|nr:hypothetical protein DFQ29_008609 [Apophysomyces sp. BC1021]